MPLQIKVTFVVEAVEADRVLIKLISHLDARYGYLTHAPYRSTEFLSASVGS